MQRAQYGCVLALASEAVQPPYLAGWQSYIAVKYLLLRGFNCQVQFSDLGFVPRFLAPDFIG